MRRNSFIWLFLLLVSPWLMAEEALTLDSCLRLARENNVDIRRANLEIERAKQVRMQAMTKFFPQVQATAMGYHSLEPLVEVGIEDIGNATVRDLLLTLYGNYGAALGLDPTLSLFQHGFSAGVTAVQPVFMGGKIIAGNRLANLGVEAASLQAEIAERDLLEQVEESYWLVVGLEDKERTLQHVTLLLDTVEHIVTSAVDAGLALDTDLLQVQIKRAELARQQLRLTSGLRLARRALAQSIGLDSISSISSISSIDTLASIAAIDTISSTVSVTPEQHLLALQTRASDLQLTMTIADALPKLAVGAHYGYGQLDANILPNGLGGWNGAVFATLSVPLTGWWEAGHKIKEQSLRLEEARLQERDLTEKLSLRTQQTYDEMLVAAMMVSEAEHACVLAQRQAHLARVGYMAGTMSVTEMLSAETDCLSAENALTDARIAFRVHQRRYHDLSRP